jgi:hypothetical protein
MHRSQSGRRHLLAAAAVLLLTGAAVAARVAPAYAAPVDRWGFALVDDPTVPAWTSLDPSFQATSPASPVVQGGRLGPGRFQVRFLGLGIASKGNVHVTAVNKKGNFCETVGWFVVAGPDEIVELQCFAPGGVPADTAFTVLWTLNGTVVPSPAGSYASVHYVAGSGVVERFNSTGANVTATPVGTGIAQVVFEKVGVTGVGRTGNLQVTALSRSGAPRRCKVGGWDPSNTDIVANVYCFDAGGKLVDSDFTASYHRERSVLTVLGPPKFLGYVWSNALAPSIDPQTNFNYVAGPYGANIVTHPFSDIEVVFAKLHVDENHIQVTASGADPNYCDITKPWLVSSSTDIIVHAICFDPAGNIVPEDAFVTLTNRS